MQITDIEPVKGRRKRYRIWLNDEPVFLLYGSDLSEYELRQGDELSPAKYEEICSAVLTKRAKLRCLHILKSMDKTEQQLRQKLREGEYPPEVIDEAIEYVKSYHYIDDHRYAVNYIESRSQSKGKLQISGELRQKGIPDQVIADAFEETGEPDSRTLILHWMEKKRYDPESADQVQTQKFKAFLLRKGFSYDDIKKALT